MRLDGKKKREGVPDGWFRVEVPKDRYPAVRLERKIGLKWRIRGFADKIRFCGYEYRKGRGVLAIIACKDEGDATTISLRYNDSHLKR